MENLLAEESQDDTHDDEHEDQPYRNQSAIN